MPRTKQTTTPSRKKKRTSKVQKEILKDAKQKKPRKKTFRTILRENEKRQRGTFFKNSNVKAGRELIKLVYAVCDYKSRSKKPTNFSKECGVDMSETSCAIVRNLLRGCDKMRSITNTRTNQNFTMDSYFEMNPLAKSLIVFPKIPVGYDREEV